MHDQFFSGVILGTVIIAGILLLFIIIPVEKKYHKLEDICIQKHYIEYRIIDSKGNTTLYWTDDNTPVYDNIEEQ